MKFNVLILIGMSLSGLMLTTGCATAAPATQKTPPPVASAPPRNPEIVLVKDKRAMDALTEMGNALASAHTMSFVTTIMKPIRGPNDQWVHILTTDTVEMQRPDKLKVVAGGDAYPQRIIYDGENFSVSAPEANLYTNSKMNGNIDAMLAHASKVGGVTFPFADVLLADPLKSWTEGLEGALYIGESNRGGEKLVHIALSAKDVDWEMWMDQKLHVPRIIYVKYTGEHHAPSVLIEFSKWNLNEKIAASDFVFKPLSGSKKVSLIAPGGETK
jgi:hypothetical protein